MAYARNPTWVDYPDTSTLITAYALNRIEDGLVAAANVADAAGDVIVTDSVTLSIPGAATVQTGAIRLYNDDGATRDMSKVRVSAGTAPTGAALIVDVLKGGTTIFSGAKPQVAAGANTGTASPTTSAWADGEYLTVDVTQIGSTVAGANVTVTVVFSK